MKNKIKIMNCNTHTQYIVQGFYQKNIIFEIILKPFKR